VNASAAIDSVESAKRKSRESSLALHRDERLVAKGAVRQAGDPTIAFVALRSPGAGDRGPLLCRQGARQFPASESTNAIVSLQHACRRPDCWTVVLFSPWTIVVALLVLRAGGMAPRRYRSGARAIGHCSWRYPMSQNIHS
jgi:hypothetical protein